MHIALIEEWFSLHQGGMERVKNLAIALARSGQRVDVFCLALTSAPAEHSDFGTGLSNLRVHMLPLRELMGEGGTLPAAVAEELGGPTAFPTELIQEWLWPFPAGNESVLERATARLSGLLKDCGAEVVQISDAVCWFGPGIREKTGLPCSVLLQSYPISAAEYLHFSEFLNLAGKETLDGPALHKELGRCLNSYDAIWAVSRYFAGRGVSELGLEPEKIKIHYAGVWLDEFAAEAAPGFREELIRSAFGGDRPEHRIVLFLGRLEATKGAHHLLSAFPLVLESFPQALLIIAGKSFMYQQYSDILEYLATNMLIDDRVRLIGHVQGEYRKNVYACADVFVNPLVVAESAGIVMVEAMASACPVVAPALGYHDEIITSRRGLLYPAYDTRAMADAICTLLADQQRCSEMGQSGRAFVEAELTWEHQAGRAVQLFSEMRSLL
ncbi:glycosyltransferase family 4 protein [Desulfotomaculum copahuensis]|uniref:Glycosyl transferase family 1 domain-containing protein n=1 Tax=Desulfotomaculum copahuensis TaxID=1838280 RepID=A0A1B7LFX6_9FIRM|nr:glycosyltransferase family 4 protein [Desulfotomaculum copahuensis]OAT83601.1 hypothetical protein A6M21_07910 [Desulfotomaculum copahuensis]